MVLPYRKDFVPRARRGCEVLLESVGWEWNKLTPEQQAACRRAFFLDDPRSIADLVRDGELEVLW